MHFKAPRSASPSPIRRQTRPSPNNFRLNSDSDSEDYLSEVESSFDSDPEVHVAAIANPSFENEESFELISDVKKLSIRPNRTPLEEREIEETISAIRLRTRYHDPYEEWEQKMRNDSFHVARKEFSEKQDKYATLRERNRQNKRGSLAAAASQQAFDFNTRLQQMRLQVQESEAKMRQSWKQREQNLWERIEIAIKTEEDKLMKKLEEERKVREAEELKRKDEELRKQLIEEKRLQEEAEKKKIEEAEKEALEKQEAERKKLEAFAGIRKALSISFVDEDWKVARSNLLNIKKQSLHTVKTNKQLKSEWLRLRRLIVVRIGQLTNDRDAITRITRDLLEIVQPTTSPRHPQDLYVSLCSAVSKAILMQAEIEVTAESHTAERLAKVTFSLIENLPDFDLIFYSKLVQRCGGWPIPFIVPQKDIDENPWASNEEYAKVSGWRKSETSEGMETSKERAMRISSLMRVYFNVLIIRPETKPLDGMYRLPRFWAWFARLLSEPRLLEDPVAPWLIYTGLDVCGLEACIVWGKQWVKMLDLIHEGVTTGMEGGRLIGGNSIESGLGRARIHFVLGNIANGEKS